MAEAGKTGRLIVGAICVALLTTGCVVSKDVYQAQVVRSGDLEAQNQDLNSRLREREDAIRKLEAQYSDLKVKLAEESRKASLASAATEDAKAILEGCRRERENLSADLDITKSGARKLDEQALSLKAKVREAYASGKADLEGCEARLAAQDATLERLRTQIGNLETERDVLNEQKQKLAHEKKEKVEEVSKTYDNLLENMKNEIKEGQITISQLKGQLSVKLMDEILFPSGSAEIKPEGKAILAKVGSALKEESDKMVVIEGHTDNQPIGGVLVEKYPTNWELSTARAVSVVRYLEDKAKIGGGRLSATGFGEFKPAGENDTKEGRSRNRRIEIKLVPLEARTDAGKR